MSRLFASVSLQAWLGLAWLGSTWPASAFALRAWAGTRTMASGTRTPGAVLVLAAALLGSLPLFIREAAAASESSTPTGTPFIETISWHPRAFVHHGIITGSEAVDLKRGNQDVQDDLRFRIAQWAFVPLANVGKVSLGGFFKIIIVIKNRERERALLLFYLSVYLLICLFFFSFSFFVRGVSQYSTNNASLQHAALVSTGHDSFSPRKKPVGPFGRSRRRRQSTSNSHDHSRQRR